MPTLSLTGLCAGFEDPVQQSQQVFRHVLTALSEPGTLQNLPVSETPEGVHIASYQICLALLDAETPLWIGPSLKTSALVSALRFHCGCPVVDEPERAEFALTTPDFDGDLSIFAQGSHEYPDRSTTLIVQVDSLDATIDWTLSGPGIDGVRRVGIAGLDPRWPAMLADNLRRFPCGVDLLLTAGTGLMGLPRTTKVEV
ncbi:phosphonate C-P lyase system protein PhnH [Marinobacter salinus]|uniref:Phosphonate C-P lyase system protein PhnH n=2 Tax=Marinobacter salinus TaxID=1874317 RepID=A0A1D9GRT0_9GAMM|nr:phosphonate C-P lyase system protein PhnH [Marinobacter salinus]